MQAPLTQGGALLPSAASSAPAKQLTLLSSGELRSHTVEYDSRRLRALLQPSCWLCRAHVSSAHSRSGITPVGSEPCSSC